MTAHDVMTVEEVPAGGGRRPDLLTVPDVMALLQLSRHTVYQLIRSHRLLSVRIGRCRRIPAAAVAAYVEALTREASGHAD